MGCSHWALTIPRGLRNQGSEQCCHEASVSAFISGAACSVGGALVTAKPPYVVHALEITSWPVRLKRTHKFLALLLNLMSLAPRSGSMHKERCRRATLPNSVFHKSDAFLPVGRNISFSPPTSRMS